MAKPTQEQFKALQKAYDYFNRTLFDEVLPDVILNLSRKSGAGGFAAYRRWRRINEELNEGYLHELSINPKILDQTPEYIFSVLVHEQCHIWQYEYGKPSRTGYHNKEWADVMELVGLIPSSTGTIFGKRTGQQMSHFPAKNGLFLKAMKRIPSSILLPFMSIERKELGGSQPASKNKYKYTCSGCGTNVWGKPDLEIACIPCGQQFMHLSM